MEFLPHAAAIWMLLLLIVAVATTVMALPRRVPGPAVDTPDPLTDDRRFAGEMAVAADRAAATAGRLREDWVAADEAVGVAWAAYDEADRAARRSAAATAYPVMRRRRARDENADRERFLHHSALVACRRKEISIGQLNDVLAHRGWNPRLHPAATESALCQAVREHRYAAYLAATERERAAWESAEQSAEALRSLRAEAYAAAARVGVTQTSEDTVWWPEQWAPAEPAPTAPAQPAPGLAAAA